MLTRRLGALLVIAALGFLGAPVPCADAQPQPDAPEKPDFVRRGQSEDGNELRVETVIREFSSQSAAGGPRIWLVGAVHIAEPGFYSELQTFLDEKDIVLFEGVKPSGTGSDDVAAMSNEQKAVLTKRRLRFIAMAVERYRIDKDAYPTSLADLPQGLDARLGGLVGPALSDAWGHELVYEGAAPGGLVAAFDLLSLGADGLPGGEHDAADLRFSDQKALSKGEKGESGEGIQAQLASALDLVFQLDAMDHGKPNWRNSDLSVDQVQDKLEAAGADGGVLFGMLDGSSFSARMLSMFLGFIKGSPQMAAQLKLMLIEMLSMADEGLLERIPNENMAKVMKVILEDRNAAVTADLKALIDDPAWRGKSVAVIYGAGHLAHLQQVLTTELGYTPGPGPDRWVSAFDVDLKKVGITPQQAEQMRRMLTRMLERQAERGKPRVKPEEAGGGK